MGFLGIPGMSFSLKRAVGVTKVKQKVARATGIPTTARGRDMKAGRAAQNLITGKGGRVKAAKTLATMKIVDNFLGTNKGRRRK
jgi:hypothetical protein